MSKIIKLTRGKFTLVDDEDFEWITQWSWYYTNFGYARANVKNKGILLHRLIMKVPKGIIIDHINRNKLDNRKQNLRIVNYSQSNSNRRKYGRYAYKGIQPFAGKWVSRITVNKKVIHLGLFKEPIEAAIAYDTAAKKYFNKYARINFK